MNPFGIQQVYATEGAGNVMTVSGKMVEIQVVDLNLLLLVWILCIIAMTQGLKGLWLSINVEKSKRYQRVIPFVPITVGIPTGLVFAPQVALALSFVFENTLVCAVILGPVAGMIAGWVWVVLRHVVLPFVLAVAPEAARQTIVAVLRRFGIDVERQANEAKVSLVMDSEAFETKSEKESK